MASAPILRAIEVPLPQTAPGEAGLNFCSGIVAKRPSVAHRIAFTHERFAEVGNVTG